MAGSALLGRFGTVLLLWAVLSYLRPKLAILRKIHSIYSGHSTTLGVFATIFAIRRTKKTLTLPRKTAIASTGPAQLYTHPTPKKHQRYARPPNICHSTTQLCLAHRCVPCRRRTILAWRRKSTQGNP